MRVLFVYPLIICVILPVDASPPVATGLKLHFDAANIDKQGNKALLDGQPVREWKDLSGNEFDLRDPVGTPTYLQPGPGFGGLPVVTFQPTDSDGADHLSRRASPITAYPFTVFAVVRSDTSENSVIFSLVQEDSRQRMAGIRFVSEGEGPPGRIGLFRRNPEWIESSSSGVFNDNRFHVVTARFSGSTLARLYVDGDLVATSTSQVMLPHFDRFDLGNTGRQNTTTDPFEGQIAEILVYDQELNRQNRAETEAYLAQKWITGKAEVLSGGEGRVK